MAAATFTGSRAVANAYPLYSNPVAAGAIHVAYGAYTLAEVPEVGDKYELCRLPKGAVPIGGWFKATDIDTGTETLDMDLGYAANGVDSADPDAFVNGGVFTGDVPADGIANYRPIAMTAFAALGADTVVQAEVIAVANAGGTGTIACAIYYIMAL